MYRYTRIVSGCCLKGGNLNRISPSGGSNYRGESHRFKFLMALSGSVLLSGVAASKIGSCTSTIACEEPEKVSKIVSISSSFPEIVTSFPEGLNLRQCKITLYQFESCPFCRKVRAVLDFAKLPYEVVEVNPLTKSETKGFASDYKKVPILVVDDLATGASYQMRDSKVIVQNVIKNIALGDEISKLVKEDHQLTPLPSTVSLNSELVFDQTSCYSDLSRDDAWIKWVEAHLLQLVVVNIYGTMDESRETFEYLLTHKDFGWVAREASYWAGSIVMNQVAKKRLKKYTNIQGRHKEAFFEAISDLGAAAKRGGGFLGGSRPSAADINAYGVIRSLEGTRTLRDSIEGRKASDEFRQWYDLMNQAVGASCMQKKVNATQRGR